MNFTASDVLLKAASRIEEEGMWCQNHFFDDDLTSHGGLSMYEVAEAIQKKGLRVAECVIGAVYSVAAELNTPHLVNDARHLLFEQMGEAPENWNDTRGRTAHEVAEAMRKAAL